MAFPVAVNDQITDRVTQASLRVLGDSLVMGLASARFGFEIKRS